MSLSADSSISDLSIESSCFNLSIAGHGGLYSHSIPEGPYMGHSINTSKTYGIKAPGKRITNQYG